MQCRQTIALLLLLHLLQACQTSSPNKFSSSSSSTLSNKSLDNSRLKRKGEGYELVWERILSRAMATSSHCKPSHILPLLQDDGAFSDLKYGLDGSTSFIEHGRRISCLCYNHVLENGDYTDNLTLAYNYITYGAPPNPDSNWWAHVIGVPQTMWQGAALAKEIIDINLLTDFLDRWWVNTVAGPVWDPDRHDDTMAGGNLSPRAYLGEVEGHLRDMADERHQSVKILVHQELALREGWYDNGMRADGCLHQHCLQGNYTTYGQKWLNHTIQVPYAHNYGKEMIKWMSELLSWYTDTTVDFDDDTVEGMYSAYLDCTQWLFRGQSAEPTNAGRFITGGYTLTKQAAKDSILFTGNNLLEIGLHQEEIEAALHRYDNPVPDPEYALSGNRFFYTSDLMVQQRREYMASVRILSNRTARPEVWVSSDLNKNGYFQADGFLTVMVDGGELGSPGAEVYQVFDWAKVPGVTNLYTTDIPQYTSGSYWSTFFFNYEVFVGGVSDGVIGMAVMPYKRNKVWTTANKSWFFFDNVIVALGTGISLPENRVTGESVITTITQRLFRGSDYTVGSRSGEEVTISDDGTFQQDAASWMHHDNIGYVFLGDEDQLLCASAESRQHVNGDDDHIHTFTAWLDHSSSPDKASHSYAILPSADLMSTRGYAGDPDVDVLQSDDEIHAVCHRTSQSVGIAFLKPGSISVSSCGNLNTWTLAVDTPCLILVTFKEEMLTVTLSDPSQFLESLSFQFQLEDGAMTTYTVSMPNPPHRGSSVQQTITL